MRDAERGTMHAIVGERPRNRRPYLPLRLSVTDELSKASLHTCTAIRPHSGPGVVNGRPIVALNVKKRLHPRNERP